MPDKLAGADAWACHVVLAIEIDSVSESKAAAGTLD
jgi:hypothetical protein